MAVDLFCLTGCKVIILKYRTGLRRLLQNINNGKITLKVNAFAGEMFCLVPVLNHSGIEG